MKKIALIIALGAISSVSGLQAAGNGSVDFNGKVVRQTCNVSINGGSETATLSLPVVQTSTLAANGNTTGRTAFTMAISGCNTPSQNGSGSVKAFFESGPAVDANGRLKNTTATGSGGASNVVLQLIDNATNTPIKIGDSGQATTNYQVNNNGYTVINNIENNGTASRSYSVQYYATGVSTAGTVASQVTYSLVYY